MSKKIGPILDIIRRVGANLSAMMRCTVYEIDCGIGVRLLLIDYGGLNKANLDYL